MKHVIRVVIFFCLSHISIAQVGINNEDPKALLDISTTDPASPAITDGVLIPRIDEFPTGITADQDGMLVFLTGNGTPSKGLYYYNHTSTSWIVMGATGWSLSGNAPTASTSFIGTTNNEFLRFKTNDIEQMVLDANGNLGINNSIPDALLDLGVTSGTNVIEAFADGSPGGATSFDQINTSGVESVLINSGVSQTFIPSISGDLTSFRFYASDSDTGPQSVRVRILRESNITTSLFNQDRNINFSSTRGQENITFSAGEVALIAGETYRFEIIDNAYGFVDPKIDIYYSSTSNYENGAASGNVPSGDIAFLTVMQTAATTAGTKFVLDDIGQLSLGHDNPSATLDIQGTFKYETGAEGEGKVLKSNADGVAFWQDEVENTDNQQLDVFSLNGTNLEISLEDDGVATQTLDLASLQDGTGTDNQQIDVLNLNGTNLEISLQDDGVATQTLDLASLQDGTGTDNQQLDVLNLNGTNLEISLEDDGIATQTIDLSSLQDGTGTDNQQLDVLNLNGTNLEISLEDDGIATQTIDLSSLQDGTGTDNQQLDVLNLNGTNLEISLEDDGIATQTLDLSSLQDGSGGTLDQAYDFGAPGNGSTINTTDGEVRLVGQSGLSISGNTALTGKTGISSTINHTQTSGFVTGIAQTLSSAATSSGRTRGLQNTFDGIFTETQGVYNNFSNYNLTGELTGFQNYYSSGSFTQGYGFRNIMPGAFTINGNYTAFSASLHSSGSGQRIGMGINISGATTGNKYGVLVNIDPPSLGTQYGIHSTVQNNSGYAGYFVGRMSLGAISTDRYIMPLFDGTSGQVITTNGFGTLSFQDKTVNTDNQQIDVLNLNGTNLEISLQDDGVATQILDLSSIDTDTDTNTQNTLDQAYDEGGAGAGRTINVDNGAVVIQGNAGGATATTSAQLILTETQANDFSRIRLTNSVETDNIWTIATRTDNDAASSRMNFNHTGAGDMFQLFGDNTIEMETYVGVNQANPDHAIHLPNNAFNNVGTGLAFAWDTYSDKRIKSKFKSLDNALDLLLQTKPQRYVQHNSNFENDVLSIAEAGEQTLGFVAQELYEILPEAVNKPKDENTELWSVNYDKVIPVAVKAIQELNDKVAQLEIKNTRLEAQLTKYEQLEARLEALETRDVYTASKFLINKE